MNAEQFKNLTSHEPERDDLERANCEQAGLIGHDQCGLCGFCGWPRFIPNLKGDVIVCLHDKRGMQQRNAENQELDAWLAK
jgi:hypothetical protein